MYSCILLYCAALLAIDSMLLQLLYFRLSMLLPAFPDHFVCFGSIGFGWQQHLAFTLPLINKNLHTSRNDLHEIAGKKKIHCITSDTVSNNVIAINVRGDLPVNWIDGTVYSEKQLARKLGVFATPAVLVMGPKPEVSKKIMGYKKPGVFMDLLGL